MARQHTRRYQILQEKEIESDNRPGSSRGRERGRGTVRQRQDSDYQETMIIIDQDHQEAEGVADQIREGK